MLNTMYKAPTKAMLKNALNMFTKIRDKWNHFDKTYKTRVTERLKYCSSWNTETEQNQCSTVQNRTEPVFQPVQNGWNTVPAGTLEQNRTSVVQ